MKKLIVDTETSGLPSNWKAYDEDITIWPRLVEIAWIVLDYEDKTIISKNFIIKPKGFSIPVEASKVHGITTEKALLEGSDLRITLLELAKDFSNCEMLIAHNIDFDYPVINCEFKRTNINTKIHQLKRLCTMKASTDFCNIPSPYGPKWPKLEELYEILFGKHLEARHSAKGDATACAECYVELKKRKIIFYNC